MQQQAHFGLTTTEAGPIARVKVGGVKTMLNGKNTKPVAVVTGANRGLGLETARQLAKRDIRVIIASRNAGKGEMALEKLLAEGLDVVCQPLDVTSESSVAELGAFIHSRCGRVDILVNNAGVFLDTHGAEDAGGASVFATSLETLTATLKTNLYGPLLLAQELVPLMKQNHYGRIVNVSSGMGQLSEMEGKSPAYRISKTALNALTRILAAETRGHNILVNSVCPGWVRTDMGGPNAERTVEQGAAGIVWAATLPDDGPNGGFFRDGQPIPW
jgi:NAD(P)-dependent dehydrogenase (short-subunit alcohol dehydrogenase family)